MSKITDFYAGIGVSSEGYSLETMLAFEDHQLERGHCQIQWLFPLPERSQMHPSAPVLSPEELAAFKTDPHLQTNLLVSLLRMREFFERTPYWTKARDHNHLRITRMIRCLTLVGLTKEAQEFHDWVQATAPDHVPARTRWFWTEALNEQPAWLTGTLR